MTSTSSDSSVRTYPFALPGGPMTTGPVDSTKHFLFASDFDQTLSFHDSGRVLAELLGVTRFDEKVAGLAQSNLVQQGGELAYLIRHDPEFRSVRVEHLREAGRRVRLRSHIPQLVDFLGEGIDGLQVLVLRDLRGAAGGDPPRSTASSRPITSSAPSSITSPRRARCGRSFACRRATARSRPWSGSRSELDIAPIAPSTSATAAPTST